MYWISFETWSVSVGRYFVLRRVYRHGFKWSPWVRVLRRSKVSMSDAEIITAEFHKTIRMDEKKPRTVDDPGLNSLSHCGAGDDTPRPL